MVAPLPYVELHMAFVYDCDECGRENFVRSIQAEMSEEELAEMKEEYGINEWETGSYQTYPLTVACTHCGAKFSTVPEIDEDELR